jgi:hypothetical protein
MVPLQEPERSKTPNQRSYILRSLKLLVKNREPESSLVHFRDFVSPARS